MRSVLFILCCLPLALLSQKQLLINGKITGLHENSLVSLTDVDMPKDTLARGKIINGTLEMKGSLREAQLVSLNFQEQKKRTILFLDNNKITINGDIDNLQKLSVTGSPAQADYMALQEMFNPLFDQYSKLSAQAQAGGNRDSIQIQGARTFTAIQERIEIYLQQHPASPVSPVLLMLTARLSEDVSVLEKRFNRLDTLVQTNYYGKMVRQVIDESKIGAIGSDAIDFTQDDVNGKPVSLSSFRGKYVLVDFWASWCGPCRMENPNVVKTYKQFKDKNFTIVGVSLDKSKDPWLKAIGDDNLAWTHVSDLKAWSNAVAVKYHIQSIPQNFLIDPNGKIIAKDLRGPALENKLCELLGCN